MRIFAHANGLAPRSGTHRAGIMAARIGVNCVALSSVVGELCARTDQLPALRDFSNRGGNHERP